MQAGTFLRLAALIGGLLQPGLAGAQGAQGLFSKAPGSQAPGFRPALSQASPVRAALALTPPPQAPQEPRDPPPPPQLSFSSQSAPLGLGLGSPSSGRRFTYGGLDESRGQRALRTFRLSMGNIPGEVGQILSFPFREPRTTALFALGIGALISVDRQTTIFWQDTISPVFDDFNLPPLAPGLSRYGISNEDQFMLAGLGLTYLGGLAFNDERAQTAALLSGKAIAYSYLTSHLILKPLFGRLRPVDNLSTFTGDPGDFTTDPWDFGHSTGINFDPAPRGTAMPSFHLTQYFAVARVYAGIYDNNVVPYLVAGALTASNIRAHHHWVSDMVAGAAIGIGIGSLILNQYEDRKDAADGGVLLPVVSSSGVGLTYSMEF